MEILCLNSQLCSLQCNTTVLIRLVLPAQANTVEQHFSLMRARNSRNQTIYHWIEYGACGQSRYNNDGRCDGGTSCTHVFIKVSKEFDEAQTRYYELLGAVLTCTRRG